MEAKSDLRLEPKIDISLGRLFYSIYSNRLSATKNENVFSYRFSGKRYDCGSKLGYLKAQIASAMLDPSIRGSVKNELENILKERIS